MKEVIVLVRKWGATLMFLACVVLLAVAFTRINNTNDQLAEQQEQLAEQQEQLAEQQEHQADHQENLARIVEENSEFFARTLRVECEIRAEGRDATRNVFFGILDQFPESDNSTLIREYVDENLPRIDCDRELADG